MSASTPTSTNWAPKPCLASGSALAAATSSLVSTSTQSGTSESSAAMRARSSRHALTTAEPQEALPIEPPARNASGKLESPICTSTRSTGTSSASAAIWVSAVRAPVPISAAAIWSV